MEGAGERVVQWRKWDRRGVGERIWSGEGDRIRNLGQAFSVPAHGPKPLQLEKSTAARTSKGLFMKFDFLWECSY